VKRFLKSGERYDKKFELVFFTPFTLADHQILLSTSNPDVE